ncbi:MAG: hypothetical protein HZB48_06170 [Actinobacteria bacterium]|nr:hypothetical protein [Actinomycetota bacterium]
MTAAKGIVVGVGLLVAAWVVVTGGAATLRAPDPFGGVEEAGYAGGAFYVRVEPDYGVGERWLASTDGGLTWWRSGRPLALESAPKVGSEAWSACAGDGTCYRARMDYPEGYPRTSRSRHLVERRVGGGDWVVEADPDTAPAFIGLAVDPADSARAVAISWRYAFVRDPAGTWLERDVVEIGSDPPPVRSLVAWVDSGLTSTVLAVLLSVFCWWALPSLQAKWIAQLSILAVRGVLYAAGLFMLGGGMFWANLVWPAVTVGVVLLVRRGQGRPGRSVTSPEGRGQW